MKLLLLNYEYPPLGGGAAYQTRLLAREFVRQGHRVRIVTSSATGLPLYEHDRGLDILRLPVLRQRRDRCSLLSMGLYTALSLPVTLSLCRSWRPDAILAFFLQPVGPVAYAVHRLCGIPYVVSLRGGDVPSMSPAETGTMHRWLAPLTTRVVGDGARLIAVSEDLASLAQGDFPSYADKIEAIDNAIEPASGASPQRPELPTFLFVGRLTPQKNLTLMLQAFAAVRGEYRLRIFGDGPLRTELEQQVATLGLAHHVEFCGWVPTSTVFAAMQQAHALILPSLAEGLSMAGLQAFAHGLPVLGADSPGIRHFVEPGKTGWLFPAHDASALIVFLQALVNRPALATEMSSACREAVRKNYSPTVAATAYLAVLQAVVKGRP